MFVSYGRSLLLLRLLITTPRHSACKLVNPDDVSATHTFSMGKIWGVSMSFMASVEGFLALTKPFILISTNRSSYDRLPVALCMF